ncbi:ribonuclease Oy [Venturia canescens]|uniref:ribonuclease Oy n=1 Tax=Venturia canescens TaxID=32260 RepID=UPI001C9C005D|nr:ribonuclease Oy [Venturia canescens]
MIRAKLFKGLFLLFLIFVVVADGRRGNRRRKYKKAFKSTEFDVLIFTQHWPQTVCYTWKEESPKNECAMPGDEEWSIHGIWPTKYHVIGPLYCNKSMPFNFAALQPIELELEKKWIDVEKGRKAHSFWTHEWEKHGTCAAVLEPLNSELKYFKEGLALLDQYDMKHVLAKAMIMPGQAYNVQKILDGVKKVLGKTAQVQCVNNPKTHEIYLFEIRICFDKKLNLVDCDGIPGYPTNCSHKKDVIYPGQVPTDYNVVMVHG